MTTIEGTCPRCNGPLDNLGAKSYLENPHLRICVPCENDETIHVLSGIPLQDPGQWPVWEHAHAKYIGSGPLGDHVNMGSGSRFLDDADKASWAPAERTQDIRLRKGLNSPVR